jgi:hypothetical protein
MSIAAAVELCLVLRELGHEVEFVRRPAGVRGPEGLRIDVVEAPTSTSAAVRRTLQRPGEAVGLLVTSRLAPAHREALAAAGAAPRGIRARAALPGHDTRQRPAAGDRGHPYRGSPADPDPGGGAARARLLPTRRALGGGGRFEDVGAVPRDAWLEGLVNAVVPAPTGHGGPHPHQDLR